MDAKGGAKYQVVDYKLSTHYGVCVGEVDEVVGIWIGDKDVGLPARSTNGHIDVDKPGFFGGKKKGGGLAGRIHYLFGGASQILSSELASKMGRTPTTITGYRGMLSIFFTASGGSNKGFQWGSNNPNVPAVAVKVKRAPKGLVAGMIGNDANPAAIIYEVMSNDEWGAGYRADQFNVATFNAAAATLAAENFGMSLIWNESTDIESFVNEVLTTINANMSFNAATGQWELALLRDDYSKDGLPEITVENGILESFQRRTWGEMVSEITLTWRNPVNEEDETVTQQDVSLIGIQGQNVSDGSRNFPGIRNEALAFKVAERELRQASAPLASADVSVDRSFRSIKPGKVVRLNWKDPDDPNFQIRALMRVLSVKPGKKGLPGVRLSLLEDIFSFGVAATSSQGVVFLSPSQPPLDVSRLQIDDAPFFLVAQSLGDNAARDIDGPETRLVYLLDTMLTDVRDISVEAEKTNAAGSDAFTQIGTADDLETLVLTIPLTRETSTTLDMGNSFTDFAIGSFVYARNGDRTELMMVTAYNGSVATLSRGVLDTQPENWAAGTVLWCLRSDKRFLDAKARIEGDEVTYRFLPVTSQGELDSADATPRTFSAGNRMHAPLRPANIRVNGSGLPAAVLQSTADNFNVTWANRNRITETSVVLAYDAAGVTPETDQSTSVRIVDASGTEVYSAAGLQGASHVVTKGAGFDFTAGNYTLEVFSVRAGLESYVRSTLPLTIT